MLEQLIDGDVLVEFKKTTDDEISLAGGLQACTLELFVKILQDFSNSFVVCKREVHVHLSPKTGRTVNERSAEYNGFCGSSAT